MSHSNGQAKTSELRRLQDLPGIGDVVWATVTQLASAPVPTSVLFTSAEKRAGTTMLASATAIGIAQHQRVPVCLIETNVRRPALARYLGLESMGLSDILDGRVELEDCLQEVPDCPGLLVLPAGTERAPVPGEFTTDRMAAVLGRLRRGCHTFVLDAAPVVDHVESRLLLSHADAVVLVLRARLTRLCDAERAHDILVESGAPVLGSIFNDFKAEGLFGGDVRAARSFRRTIRVAGPAVFTAPVSAGRPRTAVEIGDSPVLREELVAATNGGPSNGNGAPANGNGDSFHSDGGPVFDVPAPAEGGTEASHRREIDILERRIAKLTLLLEQTESELRRIAAMKNIDLGIASLYRNVQGLSAEEEAQAFKRTLMQEIFRANLELKTAMARRP